MLKIMIYREKAEETTDIKNIIRKLVTTMKIPCIIDTYLRAESVFERLNKNYYEYDILILDTSLKESFSICELLRGNNRYSALLLFCSSMEELYFFMKFRPSMIIPNLNNPVSIAKQIYAIYHELEQHKYFFTIRNKDELVRIPYENIEYFESSGRFVYLNSRNMRGKYEFVSKLEDVSTQVPSDLFLRCHQSYLVNRMNIQSIDRIQKKCLMLSGKQIDISRRHYKEFTDEYLNRMNLCLARLRSFK